LEHYKWVITSALHAYDASLDHAHAIVYVLDDLGGGVDAGGFGNSFHEGNVPLMLHSAKLYKIPRFS